MIRFRKKKSGKIGSLQVIFALLVGSAVLRVGSGTGEAFARNSEDIETKVAQHAQTEDICKTTHDLELMLMSFAEREEQISSREAALQDRMHALQIADERLSGKLSELRQTENELRDTIALADTAAENDLDRLTRVYESMKPKQAAALFEEMNPNFAAGFLGRMRPDAAAAVMAGLSPEAAHLFSVVLAGRNASVPTE